MIEVVRAGNRWTWRFIAACGRALAWTPETFPDDAAAFADARARRVQFLAMADAVDHRMGACI